MQTARKLKQEIAPIIRPGSLERFLRRHGHTIRAAAFLIKKQVGKAGRVTRYDIAVELKALPALKNILSGVPDYRLMEFLSAANKLGAFHEYGFHIRPGVGFTSHNDLERKRLSKVIDIAEAVEQRDFNKELEQLRRDAGL